MKSKRLLPTLHDEVQWLESVRWGKVARCPYCNSTATTPAPKENRHHCNFCKTTFSVTVNTLFHRSHLPLRKWIQALSLFTESGGSVQPSCLATALHVNKNTACRVRRRIKEALTDQRERELIKKILERHETESLGEKPSGRKNS